MGKDLIPTERIEGMILQIRGQKVMLDRDLAFLYGVETKTLKRAVRRNITRFPDDFMFVLNTDEFEVLRCQIGTSKSDPRGSSKYLPLSCHQSSINVLSLFRTSCTTSRVSVQQKDA